MAVYTSGDWYVKAGREEEFKDAWRELADWTGADINWRGWAKLMQDKEEMTHFRSIAEWPDQEMVDRWRASDGFQQRIAKIRELVTDMRIATLSVVFEVEAPAVIA
jgi:quinol monooxygenase YgiN